MTSDNTIYYDPQEVRELLKNLPKILSHILTPKSSMKSIGTRDFKVYQVHYSTFMLDLLADLSLVCKKLPRNCRKILTLYYVWGYTDIEIARLTNVHYNSIVFLKSQAMKAIVDCLCKGDESTLKELQNIKIPKPQKNRRPITRAFFWIRENINEEKE